jgi:hypothetical protein
MFDAAIKILKVRVDAIDHENLVRARTGRDTGFIQDDKRIADTCREALSILSNWPKIERVIEAAKELADVSNRYRHVNTEAAFNVGKAMADFYIALKAIEEGKDV